MSAASDQNLLFGVLALQTDAITAEQLIQAMHRWVADKSRTLGELLLEQGAISQDHFIALKYLVLARIQIFNNDPTESLAHLRTAARVSQLLGKVEDGDLDASLRVIGSARGPQDDDDSVVDKTCEFVPATGSSTGGRFRILRMHDEGGLGRIYLAEDTELGRQVALKELKESQAQDSVSRNRFVTEAEITGGLEHPGIVPVYGLGHYDDGRPFYAMRFIRGDNLRIKIREFHETDWSQQGGDGAKAIELRRLLSRFIDVCEAVHYAHQRGVLHRDLKPGNIMVGRYGETLVVDWGLAKSLGQREFTKAALTAAAETTLVPQSGSHATATVQGAALGTPAFMSPEQARGEHDQLGPATDIFGLGATLYMLITNQRPYQGEDNTLAAAIRGAYQRPRSINPAISRPLEAICLRAMAVRPEDRYPSAEALAADVEQLLGDEPVSAYKEGWFERTRRWLRRNSMLAATLLGVGFTAVIFLAERSLSLGDINRLLQAETRIKEDVENIMMDAISIAKLKQGSHKVSIDEALLRALRNPDIDRRTEAELLFKIGRTYNRLGRYADAQQQLERSRTIKADLFDENSLETLRVLNELGTSYLFTKSPSEAIAVFEQTLAQRRRRLGGQDPETLNSMHGLATAYLRDGQFEKAISLFEQTVKLRQAVLGPENKETLKTIINLALAYGEAGKHGDAARNDDADMFYEDDNLAARIQKFLGEDAPDTLKFFNNKAYHFYHTHRLEAAYLNFRKVLELRREVLGPEHDDTLASMHNLARCLESLGRLNEAESLYRELLDLLGDTSLEVQPEDRRLKEWSALQSVQLQQRKFGDALNMIEKWQDALSNVPTSADTTLLASTSQAEALLGLGRISEALDILRNVVPQLEESNVEPFQEWRGQSLLGSAAAQTDDRGEPPERMLSAFRSLRAELPRLRPHYRWYVARAAERLLDFYRAQGDAEQTAIWQQELADVNTEIVRLRNEPPSSESR